MDTKDKCKKMSSVLRTAAERLNDEELGKLLWQEDEAAMQLLAAHLFKLLKRAKDLEALIEKTKPVIKKERKKRNSKLEPQADEEEDDPQEWPNLIDG